ncbi:XPG domain-containing protein [Colletotrichum lupini]|uniref:XPG domain-containing protein n=1 Tax=Colletotrichum lupini TaxID=145971 RepID=A0A9Q8WL31_9PEZI|nr:XPG domain-containing protein [Colletotrichum lupini]UQC87354.1 XPG domain-containing protein [Colletotrichum lupini]
MAKAQWVTSHGWHDRDISSPPQCPRQLVTGEVDALISLRTVDCYIDAWQKAVIPRRQPHPLLTISSRFKWLRGQGVPFGVTAGFVAIRPIVWLCRAVIDMSALILVRDLRLNSNKQRHLFRDPIYERQSTPGADQSSMLIMIRRTSSEDSGTSPLCYPTQGPPDRDVGGGGNDGNTFKTASRDQLATLKCRRVNAMLDPSFPASPPVVIPHQFSTAAFAAFFLQPLRNGQVTTSFGEMGIKHLFQIIKEEAPDAIKEGEIKAHFGRKVAIDA